MSDSIQRPKAAAGQDGAGHAEELAERVEELVDAGLVDARLVDPELADEGPGAVGIEDAELGDPALTVAAAPVPQAPGLEAERDRLARTLRDTRMQLAMTQARLNALEQSATLVLGRTLVRAAKHPWPRGVQLPAELYRMWRGRGGPSTAPNVPAMASAQLSDMAGAGERFLSALTAPGLTALGAAEAGAAPPAAARRGAPGLVITGLLTARGCADLAPDAAVHPLLPHDADVVLESVGTDLVLIEAAALLAGSPWAYAGDPAGADRGRRLGRLITAAQALGKPVIFVRNAPPYLAAGLDWIAASCDAVSDGGLGVQLARFNPIGRPPGRPGDPVYAGARDPREPAALRILLDTVTGDGGPVRLTGEVPWQRLPAVYAEHALFLAATADQAREQLACGARVITVTGGAVAGAVPPGSPGGWTVTDLVAKVAEFADAGPPTAAEVLPVLREIFAKHATAARLTALTRLAGLPDGMVTGRRVAVLARAETEADVHALAAVLARQRFAPAEVVLSVGADNHARLADHAVPTAFGALAAHGVTIRTVTTASDGPGWLAQAADATRSPWVAPWRTDREHDDWSLLDLVCARECSRADAVGQAGRGYEFTASVEPSLAHRELIRLAPDPDPVPTSAPASVCALPVSIDARHGLRLFSVS